MDARPAAGGGLSRRTFLKNSLATAAIGAAAARFAPFAFAQGGETLRVGLVGCGGRGTGAAMDTLRADPNSVIVAMGDAFGDRLTRSLEGLQGSDLADRVQVTPENCFTGLDSYKQVIDSDIDIVLLCSTPHFRPDHFAYAVEKGKHSFVEKPVAVDAPGCRRILASGEQAAAKGLTVVSGLCWRYEQGMIDTVARIRDGALGQIVNMQTTRHNTGVGKFWDVSPDMSDFTRQLRNWYYYTWLSADFYVEQFVHDLDMMVWALGDEYPTACQASGGRTVRQGTEWGNIYDHFSAIYEFASGVRLFADTRQWPACDSPYVNTVFGTEGQVPHMMSYTITGKSPWKGKGGESMYTSEHRAMYGSIRGATPRINNSDYMGKSTLMGIMGRQSAYTGRTLTWDQILNSTEDLTPPTYSLDAPIPEPPVAVPGQTQFQ